MLFQSSRLKARISLFTETWQKRHSSFELPAFENITAIFMYLSSHNPTVGWNPICPWTSNGGRELRTQTRSRRGDPATKQQGAATLLSVTMREQSNLWEGDGADDCFAPT